MPEHIVRSIGMGLVLAASVIGASLAEPVGTSSNFQNAPAGFGAGHHGGHKGSGWNNHNGGWNRPDRPGHDRGRDFFSGEGGASAIDNYYNNCNPDAEYCGGRSVTPRYRTAPTRSGGYSAESGDW